MKIAGLVLAVILVIIGGFFIWLRTSSGSAFVFNQLSRILAETGYNLSADEFQGPLPSRIFIRNLSLADAEGPLVKAETAELRLAPLALLRRTVHIPLLTLHKPQIIRLPQSQDQPEEEEDSGPFSLPVKIRLDKLEVTDGLLAEKALAPAGMANQALFFKADGRASLIGAGSEAVLSADIQEGPGHELLSLQLALSQKDLLDHLNLSLKIDDRPGGFLGGLLDDPAWPGLTVDLSGQGPLNNWSGKLTALGGFGQTAGEIGVKGQSGNIWRDFIEKQNFSTDINLSVQGGDKFPMQAKQWLGELIQLTGSARFNEQNIGLDLTVAGASGLSLQSQLKGTLADEAKGLELTASIDGLKNPESGGPQGLKLTADLHLDDNLQSVKDLLINGNGLKLAASLDHYPATGALKGDVSFNTTADSPLVSALLNTAGLSPQDFGGEIDLTAAVDWQGLSEPTQARLKLNGRRLIWPSKELEQLIGPSVILTAELNGGGAQPLRLNIAQAGSTLLNLSADASVDLAEEISQSRFTTEATATLSDLAALTPDLTGALQLHLTGSGTPADLQAGLNLASDIVGTPQGEFKKLALNLDLTGDLLSASRPDNDDGLNLGGGLSLKSAESPGGPLDLSLAWVLKQVGDELDLSLSKLSGDLAGLKLSGDLRAVLAEETKLDGYLNVDVDGWDKLAALTGQKFSGDPAKLVLKLDSSGGDQAAEASLDLPSLRLNSGKETLLSLKKTSLRFNGRELFKRPSLDLNLALGNGLAGPVTWQSGLVEAKGLEGRGAVSAALNQARLNGKGGTKADGLKLEAQYEIGDEPKIDLERLDFQLAGSGLSLKDKTTINLGEHLAVSPFELNFKPGGQLTANLDLRPGAMTVKAQGSKIPFKAFKAFAPDSVPDGEIQSLNINLGQTADGLAGTLDLKTAVSAKELRNIKPVLTLNGDLSAGPAPSLKVDGKIEGGSGWNADGLFNARLPLTAGIDGGLPQANMNAAVSGELKFVGPVGPLWTLAGQPDRSFNGMLQLEAKLGGSLANPQPRGSLYLAGGRYEDSVLGVLVNNIKLEVQSTPELPVKALLSAEDGKKGGLALEAQLRDLNAPNLKAKGRLNQFSPMHRDDLVVFISGDFGAEGPLDRLSLSSNLTVDQGELDLQIIASGGSVSTLPISNIGDGLNRSSRGMRTDLKVSIPGRFFIRGPGLESEWKGTMSVGGSTGNPSLTGHLAPVRGYYTFAAKEFQFTGGDISFSGGTNPILNLELTNKTPGLTAILRFGGSATKPTLTMESQPALPEEEVLSHVLFGKSASAISRFEALQLASAINDLRNFGSSGFNALGMVRSSLGLDVLRLGGSNENRERQISGMSGSLGQEMSGAGSSQSNGDQSDDISVEAGKYLSDNIYVGVEHSGVGGAAVRLEVELAPSVSFEARSSTESSRVGLGWKRDY